MNRKKPDMGELRSRAEEKLQRREAQIPEGFSSKDARELVHELGTYHIELELQNEELRLAREELENSRRRYSDLYEFAPVGYLAMDGEGVVFELNHTFSRLLGMDKDLLSGKPFSAYVASEYQMSFREHVLETLKSRTRQVSEVRLVKKDGTLLDCQLVSVAVEWQGRDMPLINTAIIDVSELRRAQAEREEARGREQAAWREAELLHIQRLESLKVMAGGVAHDFNNLMQAITGNAQLAAAELEEGSPAAGYLESITRSSELGARLSRQMLSYSGKDEFAKEAMDLNALIDDVARVLSATVSRKARVSYDLSGDLPAIIADPRHLQQVVMNLIVNASDALGNEEGSIEVSSGTVDADLDYLSGTYLGGGLKEGMYAYFEVTDTGGGMDKKTRDKIFDPFFTTKFTGRGLGLSAVLGIVRGHEGAIEVESEPGKGTRFRVLIPCPEIPVRLTQDKPPPAPESHEAEHGSYTILLVEDDKAILNVTERLLKREGFKVLTASDGNEAVKTFRNNSGEVSVVLMDLIMPGISGEDAARQIRGIRDDTNIILTTGYHDLELGGLSKGPGITETLYKPYKMKALVEKINDVLANNPTRTA